MRERRERYAALMQHQAALDRKLKESRRERRTAIDGVLDGSATLDQYAIVLKPLVKEDLKMWGPTLTIGSARNQLGLPMGQRRDDAALLHLPGDVFSFGPTERISSEVMSSIELMEEVLHSEGSNPDDRLAAALARLTIGPQHGAARRAYFWGGKCQSLASKRFCYHQHWCNNGLLGVWSEVNELLAHAHERVTGESLGDSLHSVVPYAVIEHLLWDHLDGLTCEEDPCDFNERL